jgi:threonine/homoserine/homoserine lactone efflux protein
MPDLAHWSLFLTATTILLVIPGPSVLFVVARGIDQGVQAALFSSIGLALGDLFQVLCAAVGLSTILASSTMFFTILKYAGAGYLIFLGVRRMLEPDTALISEPQEKDTQPSTGTMPMRSLVVQGFLVNAFNPKTALFFLALLPQFVAQNAGPVSLQILALGGVFVVLGFVTNSIYGRMGGKLSSLARRSLGFRRAARYVGGGTLVALGIAAVVSPTSHRSAHATR